MANLTDQEDLSARRIGDAAKQHVVSWAKWMFGAFVVLAAIVGFRAYSDYQDTLKKLNDDQNKRVEIEVKNEVSKAIASYEKFTGKMIEAVVEAEVRQKDLKKSIDGVQKQVATADEELAKFRQRLSQLNERADADYQSFSAQLTVTVSKSGITGSRKDTELQFVKSVESFAREVGLAFSPKIVFKNRQDSNVQFVFNEKTGEHEVNPEHVGSPDLAKYVAVMGYFFSKNFVKCKDVLEKDFTFWQEFRLDVTNHIIGGAAGWPGSKILPLFKFLETKASKEQIRKLAVRVLDGYQCDWSRSTFQSNILKISTEQSIVPAPLIQEAFASVKY